MRRHPTIAQLLALGLLVKRRNMTAIDKGRALIRATSRRGTESRKAVLSERRTGRLAEPTVCEQCGAIFSRRAWRRSHTVTDALLSRAVWTECPACKQISRSLVADLGAGRAVC